MWFSSAAAKRLTGRYFDLHSHLQAALLRDRERTAARQAEEEARLHSAHHAELASSRVQQRKERDRALQQQQRHAGDRAGHRMRRRHSQPVEQWIVDPTCIPQPLVELTSPRSHTSPTPFVPLSPRQPLSPPSLPTSLPTPLIDSVLRSVRCGDTGALNRLLIVQTPQTALVIANLTSSITRSSLLHLTLSLPTVSLPMLSLLLSHQADPNHLDCTRSSPLHLACGLRSVKAVKALITAGADVEVVNERGEVCWEVSGGGDEGRKMRTVIELVRGERDGGVARRALEEKRREEDKVRRVWQHPYYQQQRRSQERKGREWMAAGEQRRLAMERREAELQGGEREEVRGEKEEQEGEEGSFAQFAVEVLKEEAEVARQRSEEARRAENESADVEGDGLQRLSHEQRSRPPLRALWGLDPTPMLPRAAMSAVVERMEVPSAVETEPRLRISQSQSFPAASAAEEPEPLSSTNFFSQVFVSPPPPSRPSPPPHSRTVSSAAMDGLSPMSPRRATHLLWHRPQSSNHRPQTAPLTTLRCPPSIASTDRTTQRHLPIRGRAIKRKPRD